MAQGVCPKLKRIKRGVWFKLRSLLWNRAKNFEKGSEYANTWKKDDDGAVNTDGPRLVVNDVGAAQGGYITK